jgi:hypothetical protein
MSASSICGILKICPLSARDLMYTVASITQTNNGITSSQHIINLYQPLSYRSSRGFKCPYYGDASWNLTLALTINGMIV